MEVVDQLLRALTHGHLRICERHLQNACRLTGETLGQELQHLDPALRARVLPGHARELHDRQRVTQVLERGERGAAHGIVGIVKAFSQDGGGLILAARIIARLCAFRPL